MNGRIVSEITKDSPPPPPYRFVARCSSCTWSDDWPLLPQAEGAARRHIETSKHSRVLVEDTTVSS